MYSPAPPLPPPGRPCEEQQHQGLLPPRWKEPMPKKKPAHSWERIRIKTPRSPCLVEKNVQTWVIVVHETATNFASAGLSCRTPPFLVVCIVFVYTHNHPILPPSLLRDINHGLSYGCFFTAATSTAACGGPTDRGGYRAGGDRSFRYLYDEKKIWLAPQVSSIFWEKFNHLLALV